ncbi:hypothetical protein GF378_02175 [Candidatus Pacearchaeota archaeon]|nr:hypothetical protein [Candidatus Pacearchaeota archaeon]
MRKEKRIREIAIFSIILALVISLIIILFFVSPQEIVSMLGVSNAFAFTFLTSFFAGFSAWTSFSFVAVLITFTLGGLNFFYLGLISGAGLIIGDFLMFFLSSKARNIASSSSEKWEKRLRKLTKIFQGKPRKLIPFLTFVYMGLTPFPNDLLIIFLALIKMPIKKLYIPIILGDLTYPLMITFLTAKGVILFT